ncbi:MAG: ATP-binding protein [Bacilli bacterium]|nr:ATP-binding protein [Bacilli bacterium]
MEFIGRVEEQEAINALLAKDGYQGCVIYGRRRMGKTELVKHCLLGKGRPFIMYQCKESSERDNAALFTELIKKELNIQYISFDGFMDAVNFLFDYAKDKEIYLVLDEYPYLRSVVEGCDSKLQEIIDNHASSSKLKLFLLGSSISTMEDVLDHRSPLYMRFTSSILLRQMDYYDSASFYPRYDEVEKIRAYAAFGGVPFYNAQIDDRRSVKENIIRLLSGRFSGFQDFLETYLKEELRKVNNANIVFEAIALGAYHYSDILSKAHIESSPILNAILQKLVKMDLIEYVAPINDKSSKKRSGYRISDTCVRFYYKFIYRNSSAHAVLDDSRFYDHFIAKGFDSIVVPGVFESICKQYLIRENRKGSFDPFFIDIGSYWYDSPSEKRNGQFDVIGKRDDGYVFFECKFTESPITDEVVKEEMAQVEKTTLKPAGYGFFSKSGFSISDKDGYMLFDLKDLYK